VLPHHLAEVAGALAAGVHAGQDVHLRGRVEGGGRSRGRGGEERRHKGYSRGGEVSLLRGNGVGGRGPG
jgi:hypothetical protein